MPLPMVHLAVAHALALSPADPGDYYLGALAPDAIHMREGWVRADKDRSHLRDTPSGALAGQQERIDRALALLSGEPDSFRLGYAVHLLTDALWVEEIIYGSYDAHYKADPAPVQSWKAAYYNDTDCIDFLLYRDLPWRDEVWSLLKHARGQNFEGLVSVKETEAWRDRCLHWFDNRSEGDYLPIRYISRKEADHFVLQAAETITGLLLPFFR